MAFSRLRNSIRNEFRKASRGEVLQHFAEYPFLVGFRYQIFARAIDFAAFDESGRKHADAFADGSKQSRNRFPSSEAIIRSGCSPEFLRRSEIALSNETYWFRENPESHFLGNM